MQTYLSGSGARMQTFQAAMQRDSDAAADIKSRGRRLTHLQDSLGEWRTKLAADRKVSCVYTPPPLVFAITASASELTVP